MNQKTLQLLGLLSLLVVSKTQAHLTHDHLPGIAVGLPEFETIPGNRLVLGMEGGKLRALNTVPVARVAATTSVTPRSSTLGAMQSSFGAFPEVKIRSDARYFYVESDSIPDHGMMVGITAWQQQVPIPQPYAGDNAWQIPLHPVPARNPMSAKSHFFRGAIALAVNGVPIYNPIKNDGRTDTFTAGELDNWGGHCGRGDDYHYHIAPVHLQHLVGAGRPVAWALDGYAIYGFTEADGATVRGLDALNGHSHGGEYHYHATKTYPYLNGGFHGEVREVGGQVDPQPRPGGIRPALTPLRGARITGFSGNPQNGYSLKYEISGKAGYVNYRVGADRSASFTFVDTAGRSTTETYKSRERGGQRGKRPERGGSSNSSENEEELLRFFEGRGAGSDRGAGGGDGPPPDDENRKPWIAAHLAELDTDGDGNVSRAEMLAEAAKTFVGYDRNRDGQLTADEYSGRSMTRSAMGGFVKEHFAEFDRDSNKIISREEVDAFALNMFTKADRDGNNIVTKMEANTRGGGGGGKGGKKGQKKGKGKP